MEKRERIAGRGEGEGEGERRRRGREGTLRLSEKGRK